MLYLVVFNKYVFVQFVEYVCKVVKKMFVYVLEIEVFFQIIYMNVRDFLF